MKILYAALVYLIAFQTVFAQSGDMVSIREVMSIVTYRRHHPTAGCEDVQKVVENTARRCGYQEKDFLEGVGTCAIWQYIKRGYVTNDAADDDYFIPQDMSQACTFSVFDCSGIETIENDETAINVELRVYGERQRKALMQQLADIGFRHEKYDHVYRRDVYKYQSYEVSVVGGTSRGYKYWQFSVSLHPVDYGTTKRVSYADSSRIHELKIAVDYPVAGNPVLIRRVRTFMMGALECLELLNDAPVARYGGNLSDGQRVVNYYGVKCSALLRKMNDMHPQSQFVEKAEINKVAENHHYISFEVKTIGWYGGVENSRQYGVTFRKKDGKRLKVIANPENYQFKQFLSNDVFFDKREDVLDENNHSLPMPKFEPYLIQSGVRFVYQNYEIAPGAVGVITGESSFSQIWPYLSDEAKAVVGITDSVSVPSSRSVPTTTDKPVQQVPKATVRSRSSSDSQTASSFKVYDVVDEMPLFPGGPAALFEYLSRNIKYPVVAEENGVQGRVVVTFIVESNGSISDVQVINSVDPSLDREAIRVVKSMPRWIPGKQSGVPVRVKYTVPVTFWL